MEFSTTTMHPAAITGYILILLVGLGVDVFFLLRMRRRTSIWPRRARHFLRRRVVAHDLLVLLAVTFGLYVSVSAILLSTGWADRLYRSTQFIIYSFTFHWTVIVCTAVLLSARGVPWRAAFGLHPSRFLASIRTGIVAYLGMMPVVFVYMLLFNLLLHTLGQDLGMQEVAEVLAGDGPLLSRIYMLFIAIALAPVAEELFFRGLLLPTMARKFGLSRAILVTSVLFAAVHPHLPALVPLFVVSVFLCVAYAYTNSIVVPIVMHMLFNGVNILLLLAQ
jgi:membrane protease YdiL (CAAX protease family)